MMAYSSAGGAVMFVTNGVKRETAAQARAREAAVSSGMTKQAKPYDSFVIKNVAPKANIQKKTAIV